MFYWKIESADNPLDRYKIKLPDVYRLLRVECAICHWEYLPFRDMGEERQIVEVEDKWQVINNNAICPKCYEALIKKAAALLTEIASKKVK